jgi:hypothetical protein
MALQINTIVCEAKNNLIVRTEIILADPVTKPTCIEIPPKNL